VNSLPCAESAGPSLASQRGRRTAARPWRVAIVANAGLGRVGRLIYHATSESFLRIEINVVGEGVLCKGC
jgi:hypothetical protein